MSKAKKRYQWLYSILLIVLVGLFLLLDPDLESFSVSTEPSTPTPVVLGAGSSVPVPSGSSTWYEVYFTSPKIPFDNVTTGGIEDRLIDKINSSQSSIDLAVYEFDLENVAQALISAKERGVLVRVVYDDEFADPDPQMKELQKAGIKIIPDERSAFMHNKFFIFDQECVWTGSFNISVNAAYRNNENALYFCSVEVTKNYTTEFEEMFAGSFGPKSDSDTPYPSFTIEGYSLENYFAPEDSVMDQIVTEVLQAKVSVHFMAFSFTDDSLQEAMAKLIGDKVSIAGIFETRGADTQYSACTSLLELGADITLDGNPRTFHHKIIIIDSETVILGSFNFSASANQSNDENSLIVHDPGLARAYEQEFQRMKDQSITPVGDSCKTK